MIKSPNRRYSKNSPNLIKMGQASQVYKKAIDSYKFILKRIPKRLIKSAVILVFSFIFVVVFLNREKFSPDYVSAFMEDIFAQSQNGIGYPYKINGNKVNCDNFKCLDKDIFILSDTSLVSLNGSAKEMNKKQHCYQNPILKTSDNRIIVYDLGGKHIDICSKSKDLHSAALEDNIISAAVSDQGTYGVVTESKGFLGKLTVFSKDGNDIYYKYNFAEHYITDMAIKENGKSTAVCGCTAQNGSMVSTVYVFDYKNELPKVKFDYNDNMFIKIEYLSNGNIVAIGDKLVSIINPNKSTKQDYNYDNKTLINYDINKQDGILLALSLSEDGNNTNMVLINKSGKAEPQVCTGHNIKSVSFKYGKLAALSYGTLYIYNTSGNHLKTVEIGNDVRNVKLYSSKGAYVLGITEVRKVTF